MMRPCLDVSRAISLVARQMGCQRLTCIISWVVGQVELVEVAVEESGMASDEAVLVRQPPPPSHPTA